MRGGGINGMGGDRGTNGGGGDRGSTDVLLNSCQSSVLFHQLYIYPHPPTLQVCQQSQSTTGPNSIPASSDDQDSPQSPQY